MSVLFGQNAGEKSNQYHAEGDARITVENHFLAAEERTFAVIEDVFKFLFECAPEVSATDVKDTGKYTHLLLKMSMNFNPDSLDSASWQDPIS